MLSPRRHTWDWGASASPWRDFPYFSKGSLVVVYIWAFVQQIVAVMNSRQLNCVVSFETTLDNKNQNKKWKKIVQFINMYDASWLDNNISWPLYIVISITHKNLAVNKSTGGATVMMEAHEKHPYQQTLSVLLHIFNGRPLGAITR